MLLLLLLPSRLPHALPSHLRRRPPRPVNAVLVRELRNEVARLLAAKVADPALDLSRSKVVEAMHHLLATDGF